MDDGEGIEKDKLERVFAPFFTTKGPYGGGSGKGTGLGLSVVQGIVKSHRGSVSIESTRGQGTAVRIDLPLWEEGTPTAKHDTQMLVNHLVQQPTSAGPLSILAVDDEKVILDLLTEIVEDLNRYQNVRSAFVDAWTGDGEGFYISTLSCSISATRPSSMVPWSAGP